MGKLYDELRNRSPDLGDQLDGIYQDALKIWEEPHLRAFTAHGKPHIDQVERNLDELTDALQHSGKPLAPEEIFVLLAACYLHDIGMQLDVQDARQEHAQYSYELILYSKDPAGRKLTVQLRIEDQNARKSIARVARGHWTSFALDLPEKDFVVGNRKGRVRLLGLLLAMADLLDLSPVRARYFRSFHRLYAPDAEGELHQTLHDRVRGFELARPDVPEVMRFVVSWQDDGEETRRIADWILHEVTAYWRQLERPLWKASGGTVRWHRTRWAKCVFHPPEGPLRPLSDAARGVLKAKRAEQLRIDRDAFVEAFEDALREKRRLVFVLPVESASDGHRMGDWCLARTSGREGTRTAKVVVRGKSDPGSTDLVSQVLDQWGEHLGEVDRDTALKLLQQVLDASGETAFVSVVIAMDPRSRVVQWLLEILLGPANTGAARIVVLLSRQAETPALREGHVETLAWPDLTEDDLRQHLEASHGFDAEQSRELAAKAGSLALGSNLLYHYVDVECKAWDGEHAA